MPQFSDDGKFQSLTEAMTQRRQERWWWAGGGGELFLTFHLKTPFCRRFWRMNLLVPAREQCPG